MLEVMVSEAIRKRTPSSLVQMPVWRWGPSPAAIPARSWTLTAARSTTAARSRRCASTTGPGASVDVEHDDADRGAGRHISCRVLVFWAERGRLPRFYPDVLEFWRPWAPDVCGRGIDATFLAEDRPEETAEQLLALLAGR